jgi:ribosomal protein S16
MTDQWRFGYGSNLGLTTLRQKKNLNPKKYLVGTIAGWELYFNGGLNEHVEPGFAAVRPADADQLHGSAFLISDEEVKGLDRQEAGYNVVYVKFVSYDGEVVENVGLYVPKKPFVKGESKEGIPSYRYLKLLRDGAREGGLADHWIKHLDSFNYYVTPPEIRTKTLQLISEFDADDERKNNLWTSAKLALHDGSNAAYPAHTSILGYVLEINPEIWVFSSWKGHNITRRNLLQYRGQSLDASDIRYNEYGYRPLPKLSDCTAGEREYLMQSLDSQLHRGSKIVGSFVPFLADQEL